MFNLSRQFWLSTQKRAQVQGGDGQVQQIPIRMYFINITQFLITITDLEKKL